MSEFRQNLATKEWVILSPERAKRPHDIVREAEEKPPLPPHRDDCPFCKGNENQSPPPVLMIPETRDWKVRVVPNKFAALSSDSHTERSHEGAFLKADGFGLAEVVIEHPRHDLTIATMADQEVADVFRAYRERQVVMSAREEINLVTIFRNHGARAGTSLDHPHSQIIATPIVPPHVRYPLEQAVMHFDENGSCVYCDMLAEEIRYGGRTVVESDNFIAFCPFAARSPFECRIYPKRHSASYLTISDDEIKELAPVVRELMARIHFGLKNPDYNYIIRSAPVGDHDTRYLHWYIVVIPKISTPAGFEIGSGIYINTVAPEACAEYLREVDIDR
jgi:UDPglucose--hexose-1-phosphate uridylyltransferase